MQRGLVPVQVLHEGPYPAFVFEHVLLVVALVAQLDPDPRIQERQLAQPLGQDVVVKLDVGEDVRTGVEAHLGAGAITFSGDSQRRLRHTAEIDLLVGVTLSPDRKFESLGERVDD